MYRATEFLSKSWTIFPVVLLFCFAGCEPTPQVREMCSERVPDNVFFDPNCDGAVNFDDIDPFVLALIDETQYKKAYPDCNYTNADFDCSGSVDFEDIDPFVTALTGAYNNDQEAIQEYIAKYSCGAKYFKIVYKECN
jgi:hypothetical protein